MKIKIKDIIDDITEIINEMYEEMHMVSVFQSIKYFQISIIFRNPPVES